MNDRKIYYGAVGVWLAATAVVITFWITIAVVIIHFIHKLW